jgi:hypothetical protein
MGTRVGIAVATALLREKALQGCLEAVARHLGPQGARVAGQRGVRRSQSRRLGEQWDLAHGVPCVRTLCRRCAACVCDAGYSPFRRGVYDKRLRRHN